MLDAALTIKLKRKRRNYVFHDGNVSFVKLREKERERERERERKRKKRDFKLKIPSLLLAFRKLFF